MHYYSESDSFLIDMEVKSIVFQRQSNGGRVPRGAFPEAIDTLLRHGVIVTRGVLNTRIKHYLAKLEQSNPPFSGIRIPTILECDMDEDNISLVSDLTPINFSTTTILFQHNFNQYHAKNTETTTQTTMSSFSPLVVGSVYDPTNCSADCSADCTDCDCSDYSSHGTPSKTTAGSTTTSTKMLYRKSRIRTVRKRLWTKTYNDNDKKNNNKIMGRRDTTKVPTQATEISV